MSYLRFNHVFLALMLVSMLSAFLFAPQQGDVMREHLQGFYRPVAQPVRWIAGVVQGRASRPPAIDPESPTGKPRLHDDVYARNLDLTMEVEMLRARLNQFYERDKGLAKLGPLKNSCVSFNVIGGDAGSSREMLNLSGSSFSGLRVGAPVLTVGAELAGRVERAGVSGATVRLITDKGFRLQASVARYMSRDGVDRLVDIAETTLAVEGVGKGMMRVQNMTVRRLLGQTGAADAKSRPKNASEEKRDDWLIRVGDWVLLDDKDWPDTVQHMRVGKLQSIVESREQSDLVDIVVKPVDEFKRLSEVQVVVK